MIRDLERRHSGPGDHAPAALAQDWPTRPVKVIGIALGLLGTAVLLLFWVLGLLIFLASRRWRDVSPRWSDVLLVAGGSSLCRCAQPRPVTPEPRLDLGVLPRALAKGRGSRAWPAGTRRRKVCDRAGQEATDSP